MKKLNQSGTISVGLIAVILLIAALVVGIFLVSQRTNLRSQAGNFARLPLTLESKYITGDETSSSLVNVQVYSDSAARPDMYRLANTQTASSSGIATKLEFLKWVEYSYPEWASADQPVNSIWHLNPIPGKQTVYLQFHIDGQWSDKVYDVSLKLTPTANPLSLSAACAPAEGKNKSKIDIRWDATAIKALQTEFLWLQLYLSDGTMIADFPNPDLTQPVYSFDIDLPTGNFTLVGIPYLPNASDEPLTVVKPLGFSEFTTNCDPTSLPHNINLDFNPAGGYDITWTGQPGYSAVPTYELEPGFQIYLSADADSPKPICGSCQVLFQNVGTVTKFHFDNTLTGFIPRPGVTQDFTKLVKGRKYALYVTAGAYRIGDRLNFTAK